VKTFSEACQSTFMTIREAEPTREEESAVFENLNAQVERFEGMMRDIQHSQEATAFCCALIQAGGEEKMSPLLMLKIAFSHGVMVGIEMEKAELPDVHP